MGSFERQFYLSVFKFIFSLVVFFLILLNTKRIKTVLLNLVGVLHFSRARVPLSTPYVEKFVTLLPRVSQRCPERGLDKFTGQDVEMEYQLLHYLLVLLLSRNPLPPKSMTSACGGTVASWPHRDERISISDKVMILGVILDKHMTFDDQIDHVCKSSINHLRNLFRIRRYLDVNAASTVIHAFITTRLDYCNHLYIELPKYKVEKLQKIQNIAARYVTGARKYDHITPILVQLHWLPVSYRIVFKHLLFVYKSLNGLCPQYLTNLLEHRKSARSLRSNSQDLLVQPSCKTKTYGDRAFSVCAPKIWNSVPLEIRHSSTVLLFKKKLKTFLFTKFIESNSLSYF